MNKNSDLWLPGLACTPSPNFDDRPGDETVNLLVIHNISLPPGVFDGDAIEAFFQNRLQADTHPYFREIADFKVSAHLLIRRNGQAQQFVPLNRRAWHAGISCFQDREQCNDFSIGIELEGTDECDFEDAQYRSLVNLTRQIQQIYPAITPQRIVGHSDIAPGRKSDPGPHFDWARYRAAL